MIDALQIYLIMLGQMQVRGLPNAGSSDGGNSLLNDFLNLAYWTGGVVAVIVLIIAGFLYVTSTGDAGKVKTAKNAILYAVIGIVFVLMAAAITAFVRGRV